MADTKAPRNKQDFFNANDINTSQSTTMEEQSLQQS